MHKFPPVEHSVNRVPPTSVVVLLDPDVLIQKIGYPGTATFCSCSADSCPENFVDIYINTWV